MRVDHLAGHGLADPDVTLHATIHRPGRRVGIVRVTIRVAAGAEVRPLHDGDVETMLVVVAGRAEAATELARGRVADEAPPAGDGTAKPSWRSVFRAARSSSSASRVRVAKCRLVNVS